MYDFIGVVLLIIGFVAVNEKLILAASVCFVAQAIYYCSRSLKDRH